MTRSSPSSCPTRSSCRSSSQPPECAATRPPAGPSRPRSRPATSCRFPSISIRASSSALTPAPANTWAGRSRPLEDPGNRIVTVGGEVLDRDQLVLQAQMLAEYLGDLLSGCLVQRRLRVNRLHRAIDVFGLSALDILHHGVLELGLDALGALGCGFFLSQSPARPRGRNQTRPAASRP